MLPAEEEQSMPEPVPAAVGDHVITTRVPVRQL